MGSPLPDSPNYRQSLPPGFEPPTSGKAIGSLISGIFVFFLPASILGVVLGHLSLSEIRKSAGRLRGEGIATVGLVLGYLGIAAIPFILIIAAIAIPNLLRLRMAANEASAVGALRSYPTPSEPIPRCVPKSAFEPLSAILVPALPVDALMPAYSIDFLGTTLRPAMATHFTIPRGSPNNLGQTTSFSISAEPITPNSTGARFYYVDQTGVIHFNTSGPATEDSPTL